MAKGWDLDPKMFADNVNDEVGKRLRILSMAVLREVVLRSPVGNVELWAVNRERANRGLPPVSPKNYHAGRFRAANIVSVGSADYTATEKTDPNGSATIAAGMAEIGKAANFDTVYVQNNLPYAEAIENGHSTQAPTGVYAVSFNGVKEAYNNDAD